MTETDPKTTKISPDSRRIADYKCFTEHVGPSRNVGPEIFAEYQRIMDELEKPESAPAPASPDFAKSNNALNGLEKFKSLYCYSFPTFIQVELTNRCNLKCIQCGAVHQKEATLPRQVFDKLKPVLPYITEMTWLGGEVFLVDYFLETLKDIDRQFPHIEHYIYTNGLLLNKEIISELAGIKKLQLKLSIDSIEKETYEKLRNLGKYDILLKNLALLREEYRKKGQKPRLNINVIAMKSNLEQLAGYPDFCREHDISRLDVSFLADSNPPSLGQDIFQGSDKKALARVKNILTGIKNKCRDYGITFYCNFSSCFEPEEINPKRVTFSAVVADRSGDEVKYTFKCFWPWSSLYIKCNGAVLPTGDCTIPIGNILTDDLQTIWNGKMMQAYRYKLSRSDQAKWCTFHCQEKAKVNREMLKLQVDERLTSIL